MAPSTALWILIGSIWLLINAFAFAMFAADKAAAESRSPRVSETTLLSIALFGGSIGAIAGQRILRHKTRKEPFRSTLYAIAALHILALAAAFYARGSGLLRHFPF